MIEKFSDDAIAMVETTMDIIGQMFTDGERERLQRYYETELTNKYRKGLKRPKDTCPYYAGGGFCKYLGDMV